MGHPVILLLHRSRTFDRRLLLRRRLGGDRHRVGPEPLLPPQRLLELRVLVRDHVRVLLQAQVLPQEVLRACRVRGVLFWFGWMWPFSSWLYKYLQRLSFQQATLLSDGGLSLGVRLAWQSHYFPLSST